MVEALFGWCHTFVLYTYKQLGDIFSYVFLTFFNFFLIFY